MTFEDELMDFTKNLASKRRNQTYETTKISLILPFIGFYVRTLKIG